LTKWFLIHRISIGWEKIPDRSQFTPEVLDALEYFPADFPEIEILSLAPGTNPLDQPLANNFNSVAVSILGTLSRGNVQLNGTDANVQPILHINALEHPADLALAVASIKRVLQIVNATGVFKAAYNPGSDVQTDAEIEQWVRENAVNGFHACGTCK
jgi:choline dehydrogenase